jgi:hypothetical protein
LLGAPSTSSHPIDIASVLKVEVAKRDQSRKLYGCGSFDIPQCRPLASGDNGKQTIMTLALTLVSAYWAVFIAIHASHRAAMTDKDRKDDLALLLVGGFLIALVWMLRAIP